MLDLHPLFFRSDFTPCFDTNISLDSRDRETLLSARTSIRAALRTGVPAYFKKFYPELGDIPKPKFHTQGSWAYQTINGPAHIPPQQADLDDGCYIPLSFAQNAKPSIASKLFYSAVEAVLDPLCRANGWILDNRKSTCTRVIITKTKHIDIPLYAIPDDEYKTLQEKMKLLEVVLARDAVNRGDKWTLLPSDSVLLAHREEDWIISDPRPIRDWVELLIEQNGRQLRRIMRYIKAWRDWQWMDGPSPSSLLLMVAVSEAYEKYVTAISNGGRIGDDVALLKVTEHLSTILSGDVYNPCNGNNKLSGKLDDDGIRDNVIARTQQLYKCLHQSIMICDQPEQSCSLVQQVLGDRFPYAPERISLAKAATVVMATPRNKVPKEPLVGRTKAG